MQLSEGESEVGQNQIQFSDLIVYIICKATFSTDPIEIG